MDSFAAAVAVGSHSYAGAWINGSNSFSGASGIATRAMAANVFFQQSLGCLVSVAPLVQELLGSSSHPLVGYAT